MNDLMISFIQNKNKQTTMADDDEIDILGDFSFDSCLSQNNHGIPSCSDPETVHPEWLLDATANNWYDHRNRGRLNKEPSRVLSGNRPMPSYSGDVQTSSWTLQERQLLVGEMNKYGRDVRKISQTLKTKTEAEIQALIDAEHGVHLDTPTFGLEKNIEHDNIPSAVQEEIVADDSQLTNVLEMVATGTTTVKLTRKPRKTSITKDKSLLKPDILKELKKTNDLLTIKPSELFYEDDLALGSMESVGNLELDKIDALTKKLEKQKSLKTKPKVVKKIGNHRRKISRNFDKTSPHLRNRSKDNMKSPRRQRKDSTLSEDNTRSPKLQIVLGSGLALPVSEGEQVIKIEKKKDSEPESDIDVDIDSDCSDDVRRSLQQGSKHSRPMAERPAVEDSPIAVPLAKCERVPRRKKIVLNGDGGYTISHTALGDVYAVRAEPRKERVQRAKPVNLIQCRLYNSEKPAPFEVHLHVSVLITMDVQGHRSRGEVMGLVGGRGEPGALVATAYRAAAAASSTTHCDMEPVSQSVAAEQLGSLGLSIVGWHHSHPSFPAAPSAQDLATQAGLQRVLETPHAPFLGFITSQHWLPGRRASHYRCIRIETDEASSEVGYQLNVRLIPDVTADSLPQLVEELRGVAARDEGGYGVDMVEDVCEVAGCTYLEKCISSISHHMRAAGYSDDDPIVLQLLQSIRDIFR